MKTRWMRISKLSLVFLWMMFVLSVFHLFTQAANIQLRVRVEQANIRLDPDPESVVLKIAERGAHLDSVGKTGDWYHINLGINENGMVLSGYVHEWDVVEIVKSKKKPAPILIETLQYKPLPREQEENDADSEQIPVARPVKPFKEHVSVFAGGVYLMPADENFKAIYPDAPIYPEFRLNITIVGGVYLWGSYASFKSSGQTPVLKESTHAQQMHICGGLGFRIPLSRGIFFELRGGVLYVDFSESVMGTKESDSALGYTAAGGLRLNISRNLYLGIEGHYAAATASDYDPVLKIGGLKAVAGLGLGF